MFFAGRTRGGCGTMGHTGMALQPLHTVRAATPCTWFAVTLCIIAPGSAALIAPCANTNRHWFRSHQPSQRPAFILHRLLLPISTPTPLISAQWAHPAPLVALVSTHAPSARSLHQQEGSSSYQLLLSTLEISQQPTVVGGRGPCTDRICRHVAHDALALLISHVFMPGVELTICRSCCSKTTC